MRLYLVRHLRTMNFLPVRPNSTEWEGEPGAPPRIFYTEKAAKSFTAAWAKGVAELWGESVIYAKDINRSRADLEIVEADLVLDLLPLPSLNKSSIRRAIKTLETFL